MTTVTGFNTAAATEGQQKIDAGRALVTAAADNDDITQAELLEATTEANILQAVGNMYMGVAKKQTEDESSFIKQLGQ